MTNFIIKITAITSLFILMCSFTDNSVKLTSLDMPEEAKALLRGLTPATYIGRAVKFAKDI